MRMSLPSSFRSVTAAEYRQGATSRAVRCRGVRNRARSRFWKVVARNRRPAVLSDSGEAMELYSEGKRPSRDSGTTRRSTLVKRARVRRS